MLVILTLLFILSGAAGLFYESVWTRYLGLFVGHNAYAQVIVLVIFLGGMAIGALMIGRRSERLKQPLTGYALVEAGIGILGLFFQDIYVSVTGWAYTSVFPHTAGSVTLTVAKWGIASALILPQSILLGMTFPLMTAGALRRIRDRPGRTLSILYFANSFGAAVGVLVAGFYLVSAVGLPGTILAATILNFVVALGAMVVMKYGWTGGQADGPTGEPSASAARDSADRLSIGPSVRLLLSVSFATAVASFIYEITWIRMLALVLSSATHAFELMLSAFILGLALGSFWVRSRADRFADPLRALGIVQWMMGLLALATLPLYLASFHWSGDLWQTFAKTESGYTGYTLARYGICLLIMLPATFCAGITLPLITRTLVVGGVGERAIGAVYGWNTLGSIFGVALASLVLLPLVGLKVLLVIGALTDMGVGVAILFAGARLRPGSRRLALAALGGLALVALGAGLSPSFDRNLLVSGVYRFGTVPAPGARNLLYYADGRTATVSASRINATDEIFIATNGKSDGSLGSYWSTPCDPKAPRHQLRGDAATLSLAALITLAHAPNASNGAVIGQGTGRSSHLLLGSPHLKSLATIEIEPEMIKASRAFYPANKRVFDDPRSHFIIDDAKSYFAHAGQRFDFIFSEPSQPWVSGVAGLFTAEFYDRVTQYLSDGGVFAQWLHIYDINDRLVLTVLAALHQKFRNYEVFMPAASDMLVIATNAAQVPAPDWGIFQWPTIAEDFCHQVPFTPEAMEATRLGPKATFDPLMAGAPYNSDFFPYLDTGAERTRYMATQASGIYGLSGEYFDITRPFINRRVGPGTVKLFPAPDIPRMYNLALGATLRDPASYVTLDTVPDDERRSNALYRYRVWQAELASGKPPGDWRVWVQRMADVDHDLNGGTAGYADEGFYESVGKFLDQTRAPAEIRAVVSFRHGISAWNFAEAAKAAEPLVAAALDRKAWMPPDELRDGLIVARLRLGDPEGARRAFEALAPLSRRRGNDFRTALLASYIDAASAQTAGTR